MSLLLRKTRPPAEPGPTREPDQLPPPSHYTSQGFKLWNEHTDSGAKRFLLELGSANPENLAFFGTGPCRLQVAGLDTVLPLEVTPVEDEEPQDTAAREVEALRRHLPQLAARSQAGALAWDLPNFLSRAQLVALGRWLAETLALDGLVHTVIYTGERMPAHPCTFHVLDGERIERRHRASFGPECPRISQGELKRDWPEFEVVRSFLLRNETQEFVLRRL